MPHRWCARFGAGLTLIFAAVPALASEWWYVNSGNGRVLLVDAQSIERRKDIVTYWTMYVIRPADPDSMTKSRMRADCGKRQLGLLQMLRYDAQGKPIMSSGTHSEPMQAVAPDTLGDAELRFACGDEGHRIANDLFAVGVDEVAFAEALIARGNKPKDARAVHDALAGVAEPTVVATISEPDEHPADPVRAPEPAAVTAEDAPSHVAEDARLIAQLEESCGKDDLADCRRLAKHLAEGDDVAKDATRAASLYHKACVGGDADSCTLLGIAYSNGEGVAKNAQYAAASFALACAKGGADRCGNLGLAYVNGDGVEKDPRRAFDYFTSACAKDVAAACSSLGAAYSLGVGVKADARRALHLFTKACDGGDAGGCYNLGVVYDQGLGVRKDPKRAAGLYIGACDHDDASACGNLGSLVQSGSGIAKDAVRAAELFTKSCELGDSDGCLNLGRVYQSGAGVTRDLAQAASFYRRSLELEPGKADSTRALADLPTQ
jgi:TPR repeat protein